MLVGDVEDSVELVALVLVGLLEVPLELPKVLVIVVLVPGEVNVVLVAVALFSVKVVYLLFGVVEYSVMLLGTELVGAMDVSVEILEIISSEDEVVLVGIIAVSVELV